MAAAPRMSPGTAPTSGVTRWILPGRAIASITERKVACADGTLSEKPAERSALADMLLPFTSDHRVAVDPRRSGLSREPVAARQHGLAQRRDDLHLDQAGMGLGLDQRVAERNQPRLFAVTPQRITKAEFAARKPHGSARYRGFAKIEWRAVAPDPAAHHHEPVLGLAQLHMRRHVQLIEPGTNFRGRRMRQHPHRRFALLLLSRLAVHIHLDLAAFKLSMILDNLIAARHEDFVTTV